jgi:hypothetical protein
LSTLNEFIYYNEEEEEEEEEDPPVNSDGYFGMDESCQVRFHI